jgi:hypothetical protein
VNGDPAGVVNRCVAVRGDIRSELENPASYGIRANELETYRLLFGEKSMSRSWCERGRNMVPAGHDLIEAEADQKRCVASLLTEVQRQLLPRLAMPFVTHGKRRAL